MKNWFKKESKYFLFLLILLLGTCIPLAKSGYFTMHDDVQIMRLYQMEKCFYDGQLPCRWVSDMGAGYGHPLYNYHPVFAYYLGVIFRIFGLSFISSVKILFLLTLVASGIFVYLLLKEFFGKWPAITGAVIFAYAPYHAVEVYVRGAMTESWGVVFFPLIFLSLYKFIREEKLSFFVMGILSLSGLFLSHNIMTFVFTPFALVWSIFWLVKFGKMKKLKEVFLIFVWSFGLSSFFIIPAFLEENLVKIQTLTTDYYNFHNHFATIRQLFFDRSFEYGPSRPGPVDDMSFQLGFPQWPLALIAGGLSLIKYFKKKERKFLPVILLFLFWSLVVFLTHGKSVFIWDRLPLVSFIQFPWRFLALAMFFGSFLVGSLVSLFKEREYFIAIVVILLTIILNISYFRPQKNYLTTDDLILSGESYKTQSMATLMDYLPIQVRQYPKTLAPDSPWVVSGQAKITEFGKRSDFWRFTIETIGSEPVRVRVPVFDFPNWIVLVDQQAVPFSHDNDLGLIQLTVPQGKHTVVGWFENTPLREIANSLSLISFTGLILLVILYPNDKDKKTTR